MKITKTTVHVCAILYVALFAACNDGIEVQQAYDFSLTTWHLPEEVPPEQDVEIRFTLQRQGDFKGAGYDVGFVQMEGQGEVFDAAGVGLVNRERVPLDTLADLDRTNPDAYVFTLFYRPSGQDKSRVRFFVVDNFGLQREIDVSVSCKDQNYTFFITS